MPGRDVQQQFAGKRVAIPQHVVFRTFVNETVVLNLETGLYHGLNPTAGRMLELLAADGDVEGAARSLAEEAGAPQDAVLADMTAFCEDLLERRLITVEGGG